MVKALGLTNVILSNPDNGFEPYTSATPLPVTLSGGGGGGDATSANQVTMISHLSDIDTAVSGTLSVSDSTAQGSLSNIDSAVSGTLQVQDSAVATELSTANGTLSTIDTTLSSTLNVSDSVAQGSLSNIDGKITACNTGAVVISSNSDTTKAISTLQSAGNASLSSIDGKLPSSVGQTGMSGSLPVVIASDQTAVKVKNEVINEGSHANAANNVSILPAGASSVVDISNMNYVSILYEDTATASYDRVGVQVSVNGTDYFAPTDLYPSLNTAGTKRIAVYSNYAVHGLKHMKLINESSIDTYTGVTATIVGSP